MLFNSGTFLKFFAAFLLLYWLVKNDHRARNLLIVIASYLFYGWWSPDQAGNGAAVTEQASPLWAALWQCRFLGLLVGTSLLDFCVGLALGRLQTLRRRRLLLLVSVTANLGVLAFFKYANFFLESVLAVLGQLGISAEIRTLSIILPVGISFYTFQSMSYTIDVYRRQLPPTRNLVSFLAYVSFFPQLVAGPIERATHLLPQFESTRRITRAHLEEGMWLMLWGMFKKVALADNFAPLVETVYGDSTWSAPVVALATVAFAFQIYCDFSGYSDIARGTAKVLGFELMVNFNIPYAAKNIREFWRRWHISLSTWLRDYLYIPLGGSRRGPTRTYVNLLLTMLLGGLWHGAAWNFALWGVWHGLGLAAHRAFAERRNGAPNSSKLHTLLAWAVTIMFVLYGWLLFRAESLYQVVGMTRALGNWSFPAWTLSLAANLAVFATPLVLVEFWQEKARNQLVALSLPAWARAALQGALLVGILLFWQRKGVPFIYFQF